MSQQWNSRWSLFIVVAITLLMIGCSPTIDTVDESERETSPPAGGSSLANESAIPPAAGAANQEPVTASVTKESSPASEGGPVKVDPELPDYVPVQGVS